MDVCRQEPAHIVCWPTGTSNRYVMCQNVGSHVVCFLYVSKEEVTIALGLDLIWVKLKDQSSNRPGSANRIERQWALRFGETKESAEVFMTE
jgi:hypothetical protein